MLQEIEIWNYRSIQHAKVPLPKFMVLVGPNGAGKTNFVAALDLLSAIVQRATIRPLLDRGYNTVIRREKRPARMGLWLTFRVQVPHEVVSRTHVGAFPIEVRGTLGFKGSIYSTEVVVLGEELEISGPGGAITVAIDSKGESDVSTTGKADAVSRLLAATLVGTRLLRESNRRAVKLVREFYAGQTELDPTQLRVLNWQRLAAPWMRHVRNSLRVRLLRPEAKVLREESLFASAADEPEPGRQGEHLAAAVAKLRGMGEKPRPEFLSIIKALRAVNPSLIDIWAESVPPGRLILKVEEHGISQPLTPDAISDGMLHALALQIGIESHTDQRGILVIEEPENAIHPWALRALLKRAEARAKASQIILTTHSSILVNAVERPESLFLVDRSEGNTVIASAPQKDRDLHSVLKESGQGLGEVWLGGALGGVPSEPQ